MFQILMQIEQQRSHINQFRNGWHRGSIYEMWIAGGFVLFLVIVFAVTAYRMRTGKK